ncbi:MAG: DNA-formamidopyrimidine glycosylase [Coprobacillus sp.]|nr:DNA-formamidopyrimidine glycosylase [Coprobacillus sp.]
MPELPEVETIKNILANSVTGKTIVSVDIFREKSVLNDRDYFCKALKGKTIEEIGRKGKFLLFYLSDDYVIFSHLRMEGKYYLYDEEKENSKYAKVVFHFSDNTKLCYDDSRSFGIMKLTTKEALSAEKEIKKLGFEPFEIENVDFLIKRNRNSKKPLKSTLLDQSQISGLGNIYSDEVLFLSKMHPLTESRCLSESDWWEIVNSSKKVLNEAIKAGGSTIHSYHPAEGIDGMFQTRLNVYGKKGDSCPVCGHELYYKKIGGRGTTWCPVCQRKKYPPYYIGLTGPLASGKSTAMDIFSKNGATTISCDEIVHKLYEDSNVTSKIAKIIGHDFEGGFSREKLREELLSNPKAEKKVDTYVHKLVREEVEKELANSKTRLTAVEVPLLFEAHFENLFDYIVCVAAPDKKRNEYLTKRTNGDARAFNELQALNKNPNEFYASRSDFVIENDGDISRLEKQIKNIVSKVGL